MNLRTARHVEPGDFVKDDSGWIGQVVEVIRSQSGSLLRSFRCVATGGEERTLSYLACHRIAKRIRSRCPWVLERQRILRAGSYRSFPYFSEQLPQD